MKKVSTAGLPAILFLTACPVFAVALELPVTVTLEGTGEPIAGAVVSADTRSKPTPDNAEIYQKNRAFHPRVLVVPVGSSVDFPNRDNTQHHVYSFSPAKTFNIELYAGRPEAPIVFDQPGVVELGCNIHDQMQGFVVVSDTPAVGTTNDAGQVTLPLEPSPNSESPGRIRLEIWHPRLPDNTRPITREVTTDAPASISLSLIPEAPAESSLDLLQQRFREL